MRIQCSRIRGGEETIWLRMIRFRMECSGCILVSIFFLVWFEPGEREDEKRYVKMEVGRV
jgi:hypothetical protein